MREYWRLVGFTALRMTTTLVSISVVCVAVVHVQRGSGYEAIFYAGLASLAVAAVSALLGTLGSFTLARRVEKSGSKYALVSCGATLLGWVALGTVYSIATGGWSWFPLAVLVGIVTGVATAIAASTALKRDISAR